MRIEAMSQDDFEAEMKRRAYGYLNEHSPEITAAMPRLERAVFEGGVAAGVKAVLEFLVEDDPEQADG